MSAPRAIGSGLHGSAAAAARSAFAACYRFAFSFLFPAEINRFLEPHRPLSGGHRVLVTPAHCGQSPSSRG